MRTSKYYLENQDGERVSLNVEDDVTLVDVEGLGMSVSNTLQDLEFGFADVAKIDTPEQKIVGDLVFRKSAFERYRVLIDWIMKSEELYFVYNPVSEEFYRRVVLESVTKDRRDSSGWATMSITFSCVTLWYKLMPLNIEFSRSSSSNIRYPYAYTDDNSYANNAGGKFSTLVLPDGHVPAAICFEHTGVVVNPVVSLIGVSTGKVYGQCAVNRTFVATDTMKLSTLYSDSYCVVETSDGTITDLTDSISVAKNPFFRVPTTEECTLSLSSNEVISGTASAKVYYYYRTV